MMRTWLAIGALFFVPVCGYAQGPKACEELKSEITKKLEANNVKGYSLEIVPKEQDAEGKVVGSCEGGTKKIMYRKNGAPAQSTAKEASKP